MLTAFEEAQRIAAYARRNGFPDAEAAREYCIDGETGPDGFWTRTVSVYLGEKRQQVTKPSIINRLKAAITRA